MSKNLYFTPGPSEMHYSLAHYLKQAIKEEVLHVSHRSKSFEKIYQQTVEKLRATLNLSKDYHVFFSFSANEIMERIMLDLVSEQSCHLVTGKYSERFHQVASFLGKKVKVIKGNKDEVPNVKQMLLADNFDIITATLNDFSVGVSYPMQDIYELASAFPESLVVLNATSAFPYHAIDYSKIDCIFFDLHYGWGLPPGLAVWMVNDRCIEKAKELKPNFKLSGVNSLQNHYFKSKQNQIPISPNTILIYLLDKILEDFLNMGQDIIRRDTNYKAAVFYNLLDNHDLIKPFVNTQQYRSKTIITAKTSMPSNELFVALAKKKLIVGTGYGEFKFKHLRFANYPLHSKEQVEMLADAIEEFYNNQ